MGKLQRMQVKTRALERGIIGGILLAPDAEFPVVLKYLDTEDFVAYRSVFEKLKEFHLAGKDITTECLAQGITVSEFMEAAPVSGHTVRLCENLAEIVSARKTYGILEQALAKAGDATTEEVIADVQRRLVTDVKTRDEDASAERVIYEYRKLQEFYREKFKNGGGIIGMPTGYPKLDEVIDGFRPGHLWVIGGYTNVGKTAASLNLAANVITQGARVAYYSLEMTKVDILSRLLGIMTGESGIKILKAYPHDEERVAQTLETITKSGLSIYTEKTEISQIALSLYEESIARGAKLAIVDFLQLVTVKGAKSEYETVSGAILELQKVSKKLGMPVIVLSQISNEGARNQNDVVMSFKGSGSIAAAADLAIEISVAEADKAEWKKKMNEGIPVDMAWNIRKNRHGRVGFLEMKFHGKTGKFFEEEHF